MDAEVPSPKRAKMNGDNAYIPTKEHTDGQPTFSVIFSLREEKGALARALKPFEVTASVLDAAENHLEITFHLPVY